MKDQNNMKEQYVSSDSLLSELSIQSILSGVLISILMAMVNTYLGLKAGSTISACIPAAILGIGILSIFGRNNILEANIVQTIASIGGSVASSSIFLPALVINGTWSTFHYFDTLLVLLIGTLFGIVVIIPLRRAFVHNKDLQFPEGRATAEILKSGYNNDLSGGLYRICLGGAIGAVITFLQTGLFVVSDKIEFSSSLIPGLLIYYSIGFSPAMLSTGVIVGAHAMSGLFVGSILCFFILTPILGMCFDIPSDMGHMKSAMYIWANHTKTIGVGTMIVGGVWSIINLINPIIQSIKISLQTKISSNNERTELDLSFKYSLIGLLIASVIFYFLLNSIIGQYYSAFSIIAFVILMTMMTGLTGAMGSQLIGVLGSSHAPISGIFLISVAISAPIFLILLGNIDSNISSSTILIVCCISSISAAISGENMQDLKTGSIVGSTPWKQQVSLMIGAVPTILVTPLVYQVLIKAYGMAGLDGNSSSQALAVPKAGMLANFARTIFTEGEFRSDMLLIGAIIGILVIILNKLFNNTKWNFSPFAIAIGMYMPPYITTAVVIGAFARHFLIKNQSENSVLLMPAGIIAGEALTGVALAIPFAIYTPDLISLNHLLPSVFMPLLGILSLIFTIRVMTKK